VEALAKLRSPSCIIDGEAVSSGPDGIANFDTMRYRRNDGDVFMWAFDLIELNGDDVRRDPNGKERLRHTEPHSHNVNLRGSGSFAGLFAHSRRAVRRRWAGDVNGHCFYSGYYANRSQGLLVSDGCCFQLRQRSNLGGTTSKQP
jgi:hypothetical protein